MTWLYVVIALLVIGAAAVVAVGRWGGLPEAEPDLRPDTREGDPSFDVVVRGYRMDEVDSTVATMQAQIDAMQAELDRLRGGQQA